MAVAIEFEPGNFQTVELQHRRAWDEATAIAFGLLTEVGWDGRFALRPTRRARWQGHVPHPWRIIRPEHHGVVLTIKPPGHGNDQVFDYHLRGLGEDWNAEAAFLVLSELVARKSQSADAADDELGHELERELVEFENELEAESEASIEPVVATAAVAVTVGQTLLAKIQQLQKTASRSSKADKELADLRVQIDIARGNLKRMQETLDGLLAREAKLLAQQDPHDEVVAARRMLETLAELVT